VHEATSTLLNSSVNSGLALAIDMTARNLQDEVKKKGLPWSTVKGFDTFTPIG
jgi:acylpyruvate hydrolase